MNNISKINNINNNMNYKANNNICNNMKNAYTNINPVIKMNIISFNNKMYAMNGLRNNINIKMNNNSANNMNYMNNEIQQFKTNCNNLPVLNNCINSDFSLKGLNNIGATCYMNSTLQCFSHIPPFIDYLLKNSKSLINKKYEFTNSFINVLQNLYNPETNSSKSYSPKEFKSLLSRLNPLFEGSVANDSKDLILFMLQTFHNELNSCQTKKGDEINCTLENNYNFEQNLVAFRKDFLENNDSIISKLFYGSFDQKMCCYCCKNEVHNIQTFNILIFPLEEVRIFKGYQNTNNVHIIDCFDHYQKVEYFYPPSSLWCNYCKREQPGMIQSVFVDLPNVLILNLNRGKGLQFNINILFDETLSLRTSPCGNFMEYSKSYNYDLIGVITHYGGSNQSGHFISYCKNRINGKWYKFNDSLVSESNFGQVARDGIPYVLFYIIRNCQ